MGQVANLLWLSLRLAAGQESMGSRDPLATLKRIQRAQCFDARAQ
jgi:hypothetical protein